MFVVRAVRDYPMSLKPGRLYSYALKPVQIKCGADGLLLWPAVT